MGEGGGRREEDIGIGCAKRLTGPCIFLGGGNRFYVHDPRGYTLGCVLLAGVGPRTGGWAGKEGGKNWEPKAASWLTGLYLKKMYNSKHQPKDLTLLQWRYFKGAA